VQNVEAGGELLLKGYGSGYWGRVLKLDTWTLFHKKLVALYKLEAIGKPSAPHPKLGTLNPQPQNLTHKPQPLNTKPCPVKHKSQALKRYPKPQIRKLNTET
jgi:hypothetical protein